MRQSLTSRPVAMGPADRSTPTRSPGSTDAPAVHFRARPALALAVAGVLVVNALNGVVIMSWRYDAGFLPELSGWLLMARENNPTTWLSSALFLVAAGFALLLAGLSSGGQATVERRGWWLVAGGLAFLSLDETASIHERVGPPLVEGGGALENVWWIAFVPAAVVAVVLLRRFWSTLERSLRKKLSVAGVIYIAGAAFMESVAKWWESDRGQDLGYYGLSTVEENLELLGILVLCVALVGAWRRAGGRLHLSLG